MAERLLALLQWLLVAGGLFLCAGAFFQPPAPTSSSTGWVYTYTDAQGRDITAWRGDNPDEGEATPDEATEEAATSGWTVYAVATDIVLQLVVGLFAIFAGAVIFCLRRIAGFMGDLAQEMRERETGA